MLKYENIYSKKLGAAITNLKELFTFANDLTAEGDDITEEVASNSNTEFSSVCKIINVYSGLYFAGFTTFGGWVLELDGDVVALFIVKYNTMGRKSFVTGAYIFGDVDKTDDFTKMVEALKVNSSVRVVGFEAVSDSEVFDKFEIVDVYEAIKI
jgi:hypothetical protein